MNGTILLVDDDRFQLKLFERLLSSNGFNCKIASSVDEAEKILLTETPDLIISDYEMPEKDGFDFRRGLLKQDSRKDIPFLFLTSVSDHYIIQQGLDLKAIDYIIKNTPASQVLSKIENLLSVVREHYGRFLNNLKITTETLNIRNIPKTAPDLKKFTITYSSRALQNPPAGDFIDFISADSRYTFIILGEVLEKRAGSYILLFNLLSYIRATIRLSVSHIDLSLVNILNKLNHLVREDETFNNVFARLSILLLDDESGNITYAGGGDIPLIKFTSLDNFPDSYASTGLLLGHSKQGLYSEIKIELEPGNEIYLVSDGLFDLEIPTDLESNVHRLKTKIVHVKMNNEVPKAIIEHLLDNDVPRDNDSSVIIVKRK